MEVEDAPDGKIEYMDETDAQKVQTWQALMALGLGMEQWDSDDILPEERVQWLIASATVVALRAISLIARAFNTLTLAELASSPGPISVHQQKVSRPLRSAAGG